MIFRAYWLQGLHLLMALCIPLVLTLLLGCLKAKAKQEDLGAEVPSSKINEILNKATAQGDLSRLKTGQYVNFINTRRIEAATLDTNLGSHRVEVLDAKDSSSETHFTFLITDNVRNSSNGFDTIMTEDALHLKKAVTPASAFTLASAAATATAAPTVRTTFHHLVEADDFLHAPDAVRARVGCGGLPDCRIPVHTVHFDLVNWSDEKNYNKTTLDLWFTSSTPFIPFGNGLQQLTGVLVNDCRATYVTVDSTPIYVRDCMTIDDFQN